jgi:hypothetical protein
MKTLQAWYYGQIAALYFRVGDYVSKALVSHNVFTFLFDPYQWLMAKSIAFNDKAVALGGKDIWNGKDKP